MARSQTYVDSQALGELVILALVVIVVFLVGR